MSCVLPSVIISEVVCSCVVFLIIADNIHEETYCDTEWPTTAHNLELVAPAVGVSRMSTFLKIIEGFHDSRTFARRGIIGQRLNVGRNGMLMSPKS